MDALNLWSILVAALSCFLLGGFWYSPILFGKAWHRANSRSGRPATGHPARVFALSFVFAIIAATAFTLWVGPQPSVISSVLQGLLAGACFVAASIGINYQFANRSIALWVIDGGYHTAQFVVFGLVFGLWP